MVYKNSLNINISWESYKKSLDNLLNQYKENIDELDLRYIKTLEKNSEIKKNFHCWVYARSRLVSTEAKTFSSLRLLLLVVPGLHSYACPLHCKIEEYILQQHEVGVLASILR